MAVINRRNRALGALYGVLVGDALGLPVQFQSRDEIAHRPVTGMTGYGTFNLPPGTWSDDSSLSLCLAASLAECGQYDPEDVGRRFINWYDHGYLTPFGYAFDIGNTTSIAIEAMKQGVPPEQAGKDGWHDNGNGALMRIMPVVLYGLAVSNDSFDLANRCGAITHAHGISRTACLIYAQASELMAAGSSKEEVFSQLMTKVQPHVQRLGLMEWLPYYKYLDDGIKLAKRETAAISSSGYVVDSLVAACWAFLRGNSFADTLLQAANLGDDSDTVAAIAGGLAGLYYGYEALPPEWIQCLQAREEVDRVILAFADRYFPN
ncbi:MAG: ADP-ribosylglycohydrolase family protein [Methylocystaceae bacterium]